ncbi:MAG: outer membrane lipid asymmetry maintenance protein MlaD [Gammaproteobacteria bacterium RIFCSPHIGHO2_12_FULL_42_13]|nr:MAG: outer membrane lipid asymmetry maintenance protein MlaD [Gammaproteobacteria bacterium RIFCSPHIGHO2_12_FULL_42_13]
MMSQKMVEGLVGVFVLAAILALLVLALKVSGLTSFFPGEGFMVTAYFDEAGQLKVRAPVKVAGVQVGEVKSVELDPTTFRALVKMQINKKYNDIPDDSSASIMTAGLLGDNYIAITPMYSKTALANGSQIQYTQPAIILEKLIGQLIYKIGNSGKEEQHEKI